MQVENLLPVEYRGEKVLSTRQLSDAYGCHISNIHHAFKDAKEHFVEGIHYFRIEGEELKEFKQYLAQLQAQISEVNNVHTAELPCTKLASSLILWTKRGAIRLCKMIGTQEAWDMFGVLEDNYFEKNNGEDLKIETPFELEEEPAKLIPPENILKKVDLLITLAEMATDDKLRDEIIRAAYKLLTE